MKWINWGKKNEDAFKHKNTIKGVEHLGQKKCVECGTWFTPQHYKEVCCSPTCKHIRHRKFQNEWQHKNYEQKKQAKVEATTNNEGKENEVEDIKYKTCPTCGKKFIPTNNRQMFCTEKCRYKAYMMNANKPAVKSTNGYVSVAPTEEIECAICGKKFLPRAKTGKYCSKECSMEGMRRISKAWKEKHLDYDAKRYQARMQHDVEKNKYIDAADVVSKLIKAGVENDVVAKYLQTVFGGK